MRLLTDDAAATGPLLAPGTEPAWTTTDLLPAIERDVWRVFGGGAKVAHATVPSGTFGVVGPLIVIEHAESSQFDRMHEILAAGGDLPDGLACVALAGARFRGQRGRAWAALRGNLHVSVHFALDLDAATAQTGLAVLPAVATAMAIEEVSDGRVLPATKWVNDLLVEGHKVAGVLTTTQLQAGRVRHAVIGIGVNVAVTPPLPAEKRAAPAGCLGNTDARFAAEDAWAMLLPALLRALERGRADLVGGHGDELFEAYRARAAFLGKHVTIWPVEEHAFGVGAPIARGRVQDLLPDLSLVLEGNAEPVRMGRMTIDGPDEPAEDVA
ncbi:MAG: biotin--[acetyl-CoA-carboxylase] ligase [Trueperaceae bacterium]